MKKGNVGARLFCIAFMLLLLYPLYGRHFDNNIELSGVVVSADIGTLSLNEVMTGSYQASLSNWIDENFWGRKTLIRIRSQMIYSLFNISPNNNVVIGKKHYLYEPDYILHEQAIYSMSDEQVRELIDKLEQLQVLLNAEGKELYIFITPSKAHFCKEFIPRYYKTYDVNKENDYQRFVRYLKESDLYYFDAHEYIENYSAGDMNYPVYYSTGIHWSRVWGHKSAIAFEEYISKHSKWELSTLQQTIEYSEEPEWPDADLYLSLNLIVPPQDNYYTSKINIIEDKEHPNVFMRGGSFMGQSLNELISIGVFNEDIHFENNYYFQNRYTSSVSLSAFDAYDEVVDLHKMLSKSDILILECNEANVYRMSFGLLDYLLEHPDYIKY